MRVGVLLHVGLLVEGLAAERAVERAYVGVDEQVRAERRGSAESLATALARVRALCTVLHPVARQTGHVTERLVTRDALVRTLPRHVRSARVNLNTTPRRKPFHLSNVKWVKHIKTLHTRDAINSSSVEFTTIKIQ